MGSAMTELSVRLHIPEAVRDDVYQLLVFIADPTTQVKPSSNFVVCDLIREGKTKWYSNKTRLSFVATSRIHYWLYCDSMQDNHKGKRAECQVAWASQGHLQPETIDMTDVEDTVQAKLTIDVNKAPPYSLNEELCGHIDPVLYEEVKGHYGAMEYDKETQTFISIRTPIGTLPVMAFALMAHRLQPASLDDRGRFMRHLVRLACVRIGIEYDALGKYSDEQHAAVINEAVTFVSRAQLYVADFARGKRGKRGSTSNEEESDDTDDDDEEVADHSIDNWTRLDLVPNFADAGYDCEDSSGYALTLLHVLKTHPFPSDRNNGYEGVKVLQRFLRGYTVFAALGLLWSGGQTRDPNAYEAHCFVMLLDSDYVDACCDPRAIVGQVKPSIAIETTNHTESTWNETTWKKPNYSDKIADWKKADDLLKYDSRLRRTLKTWMPSSVIHKQDIYGLVATLITADHRGHALHLMTESTEHHNRLGVPMMDLMQSKRSVQFHTVINLDADDISTLNNAIRQLPLCRLPRMGWPASTDDDIINKYKGVRTRQKASSSDTIYFTLRPQDMNDKVKNAMEAFYSQTIDKDATTILPLCETLSLMEVAVTVQ